MDTEIKIYPTIGLEIHAELKTNSKMFSPAKNNPDETEPNKNIHPIDVGHPGALPTLNYEAIESMVKIGLAVKGKVANFTEFDRKHYFYPDIPKGYQISQYKYPIVEGGEILGIPLERIHLEEDTGTSLHDQGNFTLVNYNRSGVPLMELVTKPAIHDGKTASNFAKELKLILRFLGVANANLEKGEMRVEANISVSTDPNKLGTKVEVKNLNSFKSVEKAIAYEIERMTNLIKAGRQSEIVQETRGWDEQKQLTFSQRKKEQAHDYRYFPDPDLPKLYLHEMFDLEKIKSELPELPEEKRKRYREFFGIKDEDIESYINDEILGVFFENVVIALDNDKAKIAIASNYLTSDFLGLKNNPEITEDIFSHISPESFAKLITLNQEGKLNSRATKDILFKLVKEGGDAEKIATENNLFQQNDESALQGFIAEAIAENEKAVLDFKSGNENSLQFLVGMVMKKSKGSANPALVKTLIEQILK